MDLHTVLVGALILLATTSVSVIFFKRIGLGSLLGLLAAGVVVGPSGLGIAKDVETFRHATEIGVVFLLFIIGLEMRPAKLWSMRRAVFGLGSLQVVVTGLVIMLFLKLYLESWAVALLVGLGFALSSTAFVMQILGERGDLPTEHGQNGFAILLMQDLAIVPLLAMVPILAEQKDTAAATGAPTWLAGLEVVAMLAAVYVIGRYFLPFVLNVIVRQQNKDALTTVAVLAVLGAGWAMDEVGLSSALGAFMMGMLLSGSRYRFLLEAQLEPFKGLLLGLFFISVGMSIDVGLLIDDWARALQIVITIMTIKVAVLFGLCLAFGISRAASIKIAFLLGQSGEFGFVLFGAAATAGVLKSEPFAYALLLVSVSMAATPLLVKLGDMLVQRFGEKKRVAPAPQEAQPSVAGRVLVAGYGEMGRVVCTMLETANVPYRAIDSDQGRVAQGEQEGRPVTLGDVSDGDLLAAVGLGDASALVLTMRDPHTEKKIVALVGSIYPSLPVIVRVGTLATWDEEELSAATVLVSMRLEASLNLGETVLRSIGTADEEVDRVHEVMREDDYALVRTPIAATG